MGLGGVAGAEQRVRKAPSGLTQALGRTGQGQDPCRGEAGVVSGWGAGGTISRSAGSVSKLGQEYCAESRLTCDIRV